MKLILYTEDLSTRMDAKYKKRFGCIISRWFADAFYPKFVKFVEILKEKKYPPSHPVFTFEIVSWEQNTDDSIYFPLTERNIRKILEISRHYFIYVKKNLDLHFYLQETACGEKYIEICFSDVNLCYL